MEAIPSFTTRESFKDKNILITGTTGFLGKVVIEKIIRELPKVGGIYLLIRGNKHFNTAVDRFRQEIIQTSIFERLRLEDDNALKKFIDKKIHCITGEITEKQFGLDNKTYRQLYNNIDLVINSAASVNFREELDKAIEINAFAVENVAQFSIDAGNVPVIHVSTCYVNGYNKGRIKENNKGPAGLRRIKKHHGHYVVRPVIKKLIGKTEKIKSLYTDQSECSEKLTALGIKEAQRHGWNDTYTFTKWMAEQLLIEMLSGGTLTIVRPSIIESTFEDPVPGWIEGIKVADAIIFAYARGKLSLFPAKPGAIIDVIPADFVANAIIICAAEAIHQKGKHRIYQCCSGSSNPLKIRQFRRWVVQEAKNNHESYDRLFHKKPNKPFIFVNRRLFNTVAKGLQLPVNLVPTKLQQKWLSENQLKSLANVKTTISLAEIFSFYASPSCVFHNDQLLSLSNQLSKADQRRFPVNPSKISWKRYIKNIHLTGLQRYALKKKKATVYEAKIKPQEQQKVA